MLKELKQLLPEFEVTKSEGIFYVKRERLNKPKLIIPIMSSKNDDPKKIADIIYDVWRQNA